MSKIIEVPAAYRGQITSLEQRAVMVEAGPAAWKDEGEPRALPGEHILVTKMAGMLVMGPADGVQYRLVNARDIFCTIDPALEVAAAVEAEVVA